MTSSALRVAIYTRLSKDPTGQQTRTAAQEKSCRQYAAAHGWKVAQVYEDVDLSAYRRVRRPRFEEMMEAVERGEFDVVLVFKLDRLLRRQAEFERVWAACEAGGANLASVNDSLDTTHATGRAMARIVITFAQLESETMSLRIRDGKREVAERGLPKHGGPRPFGYAEDRVTVLPLEAALIREAASRVLAGESMRGIVLDWNARGIPAPSGGVWKQASLRQLLLQERLLGHRTHKGEVVARDCWEPILDEETHARLSAVLRDPSRRTGGAPVRSYLLTGLVRCGRCGGRMRSTQPRGGKRKYHCPGPPEGCMGVSVLAEPAEGEVERQVIEALDSPALAEVEAEGAAGAEDPLREARDLQARLDELGELAAAGELGPAAFAAASAPVERRLGEAQARLAETSVRVPLPPGEGPLAERWDDLTFDQRREVLRAVVTEVTVEPVGKTGPGPRRFNPERVRVLWRA